jgi:resolvase-like protein
MTTSPLEPLPSPKLKPWHLDRVAVVYVRQSTPQQVADHQESTARQYALAERAVLLGWPRGQVVVIDDDLGKSGQSIEGRPGFQRLLAEVALDQVGLILGLEMSRLARSCKDWHQLLELCARFRVLLAAALGPAGGVAPPRADASADRRRPGPGRVPAAEAVHPVHGRHGAAVTG